MAFCSNCGTQIQGGINFCHSCGQMVGSVPAQLITQPPQQSQFVMSQSDTEENKGMAVLSYFIFPIPLLLGKHKTSPFVKFHLNQSILLSLIAVGYSIISNILYSIIKIEQMVWYVPVRMTPPWLGSLLWSISIPIFILLIIGIVNAINGEMKPLPVIGDKITIIK